MTVNTEEVLSEFGQGTLFPAPLFAAAMTTQPGSANLAQGSGYNFVREPRQTISV